jgi:hypothetical protein
LYPTLNLIEMKKMFTTFISAFTLVLFMHSTYAQTKEVTLDFTVDPEWDGSGNTGNTTAPLHDYGYRNVEGVTGIYPGDYGCIGGVFARSSTYSYYADTDLNGVLDRTMTIRMAGSFYLENRTSSGFDGNFYLGYFDATNPGKDNFIGISFAEPSGGAEAPFRGFTGVNGPGGKEIGIIPLTQIMPLTFDLTWTGSADGSGTFKGQLAGQDVNLTVDAGSSTFNAFGLLCGGTTTTANLRTRSCYFDNLTYTQIGASSVDQKSMDMFSVYPVITSDKIYFNNIPEDSRVELVDMTGRTLLVKKASELNNGMSLLSYERGVYIIRLKLGLANEQSVKVIRN